MRALLLLPLLALSIVACSDECFSSEMAWIDLEGTVPEEEGVPVVAVYSGTVDGEPFECAVSVTRASATTCTWETSCTLPSILPSTAPECTGSLHFSGHEVHVERTVAGAAEPDWSEDWEGRVSEDCDADLDRTIEAPAPART